VFIAFGTYAQDQYGSSKCDLLHELPEPDRPGGTGRNSQREQAAELENVERKNGKLPGVTDPTAPRGFAAPTCSERLSAAQMIDSTKHRRLENMIAGLSEQAKNIRHLYDANSKKASDDSGVYTLDQRRAAAAKAEEYEDDLKSITKQQKLIMDELTAFEGTDAFGLIGMGKSK
jgi:hypothetical protein